MNLFRIVTAFILVVLFSTPAFSMTEGGEGGFNVILGILELPFLIIAVVFSFMNASALKGGKFGAGMNYLAWGFMVMAVGHLHMQIDFHFGFNLFNTILGTTGGMVAWFIALMLTWGLSGMGFYKIYKVSRA